MVDDKKQFLSENESITEKTSTFGLEELLDLRDQLDFIFQQLQTVMGYSKQK